ncbi:TolC family outer membrane protein [Pleomorphomonas sp. JP5]|uniref:TolC family outer membrane protein n=1 Tax=Pleomorphomonas sp. JP5 TaxID=2942998 RepID=UPI00211EFCFC|nr:TolC family outer membrane protein [Pleomorphomonas sp. JP5]
MRCVVAFRPSLYLSAAVGLFLALSGAASAESLQEAMAAAYANNPSLNAARAGTRAVDENVPQALSGYRPTINGQISAGITATDTRLRPQGMSNWASAYTDTGAVRGEIKIVQPLYMGGRIDNGVKRAESAVKASREQLRNTEQSTLLDTASAYMNVILSGQVLELRKSNVAFLQEQVRASNDRFSVGEGTRTDVSQAQAALAAATAAVSAAQADLLTARANYVKVVGHEPKGLRSPGPITKLLPARLSAAIDASRTEHPMIRAAIHNADTASYNVEIQEGALLPSFVLQGTVSSAFAGSVSNDGSTPDRARSLEGSVAAVLSIPIYQGGSEYATVRQAKEELGQAKLQVDVARMSVDAALAQAWSALESARAQIVAAEASVKASRLALEGVVEEQKVGQRTTLDVLNAQSTLIDARLSEVGAQAQFVVASYSVVAAMGRLDRERLGLKVTAYKPEHHYEQVRDKWIGLRTPDGR